MFRFGTIFISKNSVKAPKKPKTCREEGEGVKERELEEAKEESEKL